MMLSAIGREFSRQLSEYKQFKVNLLFANLGIFFLVTGFLTYFDSQQDTFELFILLFTWSPLFSLNFTNTLGSVTV